MSAFANRAPLKRRGAPKTTVVEHDDEVVVAISKRKAAQAPTASSRVSKRHASDKEASKAAKNSASAPQQRHVVPRQREKKEEVHGRETFCTFLRRLFQDGTMRKFMFTRWRCNSDGDISFQKMARKMCRLLFEVPVAFMIVQEKISTHVEDYFSVPFTDLSKPHVDALLRLTTQDEETKEFKYTCVLERFVQKTSMINFEITPEDDSMVVYNPCEMFVHFIDFELLLTDEPSSAKLVIEIINLIVNDIVATRRDFDADAMAFFNWLSSHLRSVFWVLVTNPSLVMGCEGLIHSAFLEQNAGKTCKNKLKKPLIRSRRT